MEVQFSIFERNHPIQVERVPHIVEDEIGCCKDQTCEDTAKRSVGYHHVEKCDTQNP